MNQSGNESAPIFDPYRDRMYRLCFTLAAAYNVAFGIWTVLWPQHFFELMRLPRPLYAEIWQCVGMMVGLYGVGYAYAAWRLDRGQPLIAIGLAGKLLGPLGYLLTAGAWYWPWRTLTLNIFNDVIWWIPFALYLLEGTRWGRGIRDNAPLTCAILNAAAAVSMAIFLREGTEAVPDVQQRIDYITANIELWRSGWLLWNAAALSLIGFYAWWGARLASFAWAAAAFLIGGFGMLFDLFFESLFIGWLPDNYREIYPPGSLIMGVVANGAYSLAGALLTLRTPQLTGWWRVWAWAIWISGFALVAASWLGHVPAIMISTGLMMGLFCPFAAALRWKLK